MSRAMVNIVLSQRESLQKAIGNCIDFAKIAKRYIIEESLK